MESVIKIGNVIATIAIILTIVTIIYSIWVRRNRKIIHYIDPNDFIIHKALQKPKGTGVVLKKYKNRMILENATTLIESKVVYEYADVDEDETNTEVRKKYPSKGLHGWVTP